MSGVAFRRRFPLVIPVVFAITVVGVGAARLSGYQPEPSYGATTVSRELRFTDQDDGTIAVIDAATGVAVGRIAKGGDNFIRATMRGLANARKQRGDGPDVPFVLAAHDGGAVTLRDPVTGRTLDLAAFGSTNESAFARFLPPLVATSGARTAAL
jgi:putative photosynthetic complex assembly protein